MDFCYSDKYPYIKKNYTALREEISDIARGVGIKTPTLVCVTKSGTDEELLALAEAGALNIGENRPGELKRRFELLSAAGFSPIMHEIGTLQRNKVKLIVDQVSLIHSTDSDKLAYDIDRLAGARGRRIPVLIEVNSAEEENKSGVSAEDCFKLAERVLSYPNLELKGLMTMGPVCDNPEDLRPYFRMTKKLFDKLCAEYALGEDPILSMGMSDSYRVAIEEGSTLVRVGRKLFIK